MFVALDENRKPVNALQLKIDNIISDFDDTDCICPLCSEYVKMRARDSSLMRPHFYHPDGSSHDGESEAHREIKANLFFELSKTKDRNEFTVECEKMITLKDGSKRFLDVAVLKNGRITEAHEIQLSRNSKDDFKRRTEEYFSHPDGFAINWIIRAGGVNDSREIKLYLSEYCGGYSLANF